MKKIVSGNVWLTGSKKSIRRTVYGENERYFIKWNGSFVEVLNKTGFTNVTAGWQTVERY